MIHIFLINPREDRMAEDRKEGFKIDFRMEIYILRNIGTNEGPLILGDLNFRIKR